MLSVLDGPAVVTPLLLADAYHARVDIPAMIAASGATGVRQAPVLGADPALLAVLRQRLTETGVSRHDGDVGVIVEAVGSSDPAANAVTARVAHTHIDSAQNLYAGMAFDFSHNPPRLRRAVAGHDRINPHRISACVSCVHCTFASCP